MYGINSRGIDKVILLLSLVFSAITTDTIIRLIALKGPQPPQRTYYTQDICTIFYVRDIAINSLETLHVSEVWYTLSIILSV